MMHGAANWVRVILLVLSVGGRVGLGAALAEDGGMADTPMVLIPEGEFTMGADNVGMEWSQGNPNESPAHAVRLRRYLIDIYEVTIASYAQFLSAARYDAPPLWDDEAVSTAGDRPVVGVSWHDAEAYCRWAEKRLPTEAEWEKAARGTDTRRFPWGDMQPFVDIANYNRGVWVSYPITLAPVTSGVAGMSIRHGLKEGGKSPFGLFHMAGNAAEWVADWYDREYYAQSPKEDPKGPDRGEKKTFRGGHWGDSPRNIRVTARFSAPPDLQDLSVGFRCAKDVLENK